MFKSIWDDIKREFNYGNMVNRLIIINGAIFVFVTLLRIILPAIDSESDLFKDFMMFVSMRPKWFDLLTHPWGLVTSMFLHQDFLHILFNMLFLYWFGRIVGDLIGDHRILPLYLLSGLTANAVYFLAANLLPRLGLIESYAFGASGAVMGIVLAAAALNPEMQIRLLLLGNVRLKYIAAFFVAYDIMRLYFSSGNTGGHIGHLAGAAFGYFFIRRLQEGDDLSAPVNNFFQRARDFFSRLGEPKESRSKRGPRVAYRNPKTQQRRERTSQRHNKRSGATPADLSHEERVDAILEKIKESGYENLTEEEKRFLFEASKK